MSVPAASGEVLWFEHTVNGLSETARGKRPTLQYRFMMKYFLFHCDRNNISMLNTFSIFILGPC